MLYVGINTDHCQWTECQNNNSTVTGCDQYNLVEVNQRPCDGGTRFHCCEPPGGSDFVGNRTRRAGNRVCSKPVIKFAIPKTLNLCLNKAVKMLCNYECIPGYEEGMPNMPCREERGQLKWPERGTCSLKTCPQGPFPLIVLETPQVAEYYNPDMGQFVTVYVVLYNKEKKLPVWSVTYLQAVSDKILHRVDNSYNALKPNGRLCYFYQHPCPELKHLQAKNSDYRNTGWDRGHLTPASVARWSLKATRAVNLYINVAPQDPFTNQGPWKDLEEYTESFSRTQSIVVATGLCLKNAQQKTKADGITVPTCFWKMICFKDEQGEEQVIGFMHKNTKVSTIKEQDARIEEVFTARSQDEILKEVGEMMDPWRTSETSIFKSRGIYVPNTVNPANQAILFPLSLLKCARQTNLSAKEKNNWESGLRSKKRKGEPLTNPKGKEPRKEIVGDPQSSQDSECDSGDLNDLELNNLYQEF
ncbi:hypothetical protein M8J75_000298 [Diaphorina citri]|nr:hypothetical protein M8J75_000298 [Diaphorina citri]